MRPTDPIILICSAIATQEGAFSPGTTPSVRNNPGDIRFFGQVGATRPDGTSAGPIKPNEPIAFFKTKALGVTALYRQVWLMVAEGMTLRQLISAWAPEADDNNTTAYLSNVALWTGLAADIPILELLSPLQDLAVSGST